MVASATELCRSNKHRAAQIIGVQFMPSVGPRPDASGTNYTKDLMDPESASLMSSYCRARATTLSWEKHMRKTMTRMGLGLALIVGSATVAAAQNTRPDVRPDSARRDGRWGGERGMRRGGPGGAGALLKGITLTDAQKTRLEALRKEQQTEMKKSREQFGAVMKEARDARQRGDTVTARAKMDQVRTQMNAQRDRQIASLRTILTAEQQKQLDANVAQMKERGSQRGEKGGHRGHDGQKKDSAGR
jgi:Spy/CpxP family protein refolding chaperone